MSVEEPNVIDFVTHDPKGEVVLIMVEGRDWDGSEERLFQLQEKINNYAAFAQDGQLVEKYPEFAGKSVRLSCVASTTQTRQPRRFWKWRDGSYAHWDCHCR